MHLAERRSILYLLLVLLASISKGQDTLVDYPSMKNVFPVVKIAVSASQPSYTYKYRVTNGSGALQRLWKFMVAVKTDSFSTTGPTDWSSGRAHRSGLLAATWASLDSSHDISANVSRDSLYLFSSGIPSIRRFYAVGWVEPPE